MSIAERKKRERDALRRKIIDAARELCVEVGYDALTLRAIAGRIDYSTTVIYTLFEDKADLLRAIADEDFAELTRLLQANDDETVSPGQRVVGLANSFVQFAMEQPEHYRRIFINPPPPVSVEESAAEHGNPNEDAYAFARSLFEAVVHDTPQILERDPDALLQMFWGTLHGLISINMILRDEPWVTLQPLPRLVEGATRALLRGMGVVV
ncbi:TetR/AcrR family transcriptional regulator [Parachitinimonas caeni]|uniref:TetR/AcrR family transcriptional regulator n=1 Tax=Parachitinimonas caeni TaxID=3031301 RepID=A0ABT7DYG5_9NEIS|nr:TetR/AcrR family transcriptional regulator [Parachitinimonas caeni]MDK2125104.1 TetR/AcrR family transcriptional regulator [Parachitinimonas caeni]